MRIFMAMFYLLIVILGISFAALNATSVQINFYFKSLLLPLSFVIAVTLFLGVIIGFCLFLFRYYGLRLEKHKLQHQLRLTEKEIKNIRSIPLQD